MAARITRISCTGCTVVLDVPPDKGVDTLTFGRAEGWTFGTNRQHSAKCPRCQGPRASGRPGPLQQAVIDRRKAADALYALQMAQRDKARRELLNAIAAQHRAAQPEQPVVEKLRPPIAIVAGRRTAPRMFGESQ